MAASRKPLPKPGVAHKDLPAVGKPENTVKIGEDMIEIKPTKVRYQRDRTAVFYKMIDTYPLPDIFAMTAKAIGDEDRDGDKSIMDWLIAVTDDEEFVLKHFEEMDTETVETILSIFKRVNHIQEKEEKLKKLQAERGVMD